MPAELSRTQDGRFQFFEITAGAVITAWHREGTILPPGTPLPDALRIMELDYRVAREPVFRRVERERADVYEQSTKAAVTVRQDTGAELGRVGPDYAVVQNADAFHILEPLLDQDALRLECGGALRGGADAWIVAQLNRERIGSEVLDLLRDEIAPYIVIATNHTGRTDCSVTETPVRVVCANTLRAVEDGSYKSRVSVRHTGDATARLADGARLLFAGIVERYVKLLQRFQVLRVAPTLSDGEFQVSVVDTLTGGDPRTAADFDPKSLMAASVIQRYETRQGALFGAWINGTGHTGDRSRWEAYNGAVEVLDHQPDIFPTRTSRLQQLMPGGRLNAMKEQVFQALLPAGDGAA